MANRSVLLKQYFDCSAGKTPGNVRSCGFCGYSVLHNSRRYTIHRIYQPTYLGSYVGGHSIARTFASTLACQPYNPGIEAAGRPPNQEGGTPCRSHYYVKYCCAGSPDSGSRQLVACSHGLGKAFYLARRSVYSLQARVSRSPIASLRSGHPDAAQDPSCHFHGKRLFVGYSSATKPKRDRSCPVNTVATSNDRHQSFVPRQRSLKRGFQPNRLVDKPPQTKYFHRRL